MNHVQEKQRQHQAKQNHEQRPEPPMPHPTLKNVSKPDHSQTAYIASGNGCPPPGVIASALLFAPGYHVVQVAGRP
jgi:hypothetical protein